MDVPDPVTEQWFEQAFAQLAPDQLMQAFVVIRDRGGAQAKLLEEMLIRQDAAATVVDRPPAGETVVSEPRGQRPTEVESGDGSLAIGAHFANYVIEGLAGRGGMGVVYRAREMRPSRIVALKVISPQLAGDADFRERFERESEIAASIEHSNVIPVYDVGDEAGLLFIAMRYIDGTDLGAVITAEGRLDAHRAVTILVDLTSALDAAHARGLVHRDIKPGNVLLAHEGTRDHVYLTDFGLAKLTTGGGGHTQTGLFVGTLDYAAPEQIEGKTVDARADVYACGCLLFQMLTGRVPFPSDHQAAIMMAHMSAQPPTASQLVPGLPPELDAVIARAMAKTPHDRFPSAGDLGRAALAAVGEGRPLLVERSIATGRAAPASQAGRRGPANRAPLLIGGVVAAIVIAVAAVLALGSGGGGTKHASTTPPRVRAKPVKAKPAFKTYSNAQVGVSFKYPAKWQELTLSGATTDFGTGGSAATETRCALEIERGDAPVDTQEAQFAYVRKASAHAAHVNKHYQLQAIQAQPAMNITGVGLLRIADGQGGHLGFFFKGHDVYVFDCITPGASLANVDRSSFVPLLSSVRIG